MSFLLLCQNTVTADTLSNSRLPPLWVVSSSPWPAALLQERRVSLAASPPETLSAQTSPCWAPTPPLARARWSSPQSPPGGGTWFVSAPPRRLIGDWQERRLTRRQRESFRRSWLVWCVLMEKRFRWWVSLRRRLKPGPSSGSPVDTADNQTQFINQIQLLYYNVNQTPPTIIVRG